MVTRLTRPSVVNDNFIDAVVDARQNGSNAAYFTGVKDDWKRWVRDYEAFGGDPSRVPASIVAAADKGKFINLYGARDEESVHGMELGKIRGGKDQFCPACGEPGQPYTLDHYLPKDLYPEYAIIPVNLFPMCDRCQTHKAVLTTDANGDRYFIHPYYDDFASNGLLYIAFASPYDSPVMDLRIVHGLTKSEHDLTSRHVEKLELSARMQHYMKDEYSRLLRLAQDIRDTDGDVGNHLRLFKNNARRKSANHWDHVWYSSVLADAALCAYLAHGALPPYR